LDGIAKEAVRLRRLGCPVRIWIRQVLVNTGPGRQCSGHSQALRFHGFRSFAGNPADCERFFKVQVYSFKPAKRRPLIASNLQ
jgi:hypothetical protein